MRRPGVSRSGSQLPEPSDPFCRWFGGACAALWAVGVQSFPDPWSKLAAILTPGLGYLAGHGLFLMLKIYYQNESAKQAFRSRQRAITDVRVSISLIEGELRAAKDKEYSSDFVGALEIALRDSQMKLASLLKN